MATSELRYVSKEELEKAVKAHFAYMNGKMGARRLVLQNCDLSGANLRNCDLRDADFTGSSLERADLSGSNLKSASLFSCDFRLANLTYADLSRADLRGSLFNGADLSNANLSEADMREGLVMRKEKNGELTSVTHAPLATSSCETNFRGATLSKAKMGGIIAIAADFSDAIMREVKMVRAHLKQANLSGADLTNSDLSGANLEGACLKGANLSGASTFGMDTRGADMSEILVEPKKPDPDTARRIKTMLESHILWRKSMGGEGEPGVFDDLDLRSAIVLAGQPLTAFRAKNSVLYGMDLSAAELQGANLANSDMRLVDLQNSDLRGVNLSGANLRRAKFNGANLRPLTLPDGREFCADFSNAELCFCDLSGIDFRKVKLNGADFTNAILDNTLITPQMAELISLDNNAAGLVIAA